MLVFNMFSNIVWHTFILLNEGIWPFNILFGFFKLIALNSVIALLFSLTTPILLNPVI